MRRLSGPKWWLLALGSALATGSGAGARLPVVGGYAAVLSRQPLAALDQPVGPTAEAWAAVGAADPARRQAARWTLARALTRDRRWAEAAAVLTVMEEDEPGLIGTRSFRLMRARAALALRRDGEVVALLQGAGLEQVPAACALGAVAQARMERHDEAMRMVICAGSRRLGRDRALLAAAVDSALALRRWSAAAQWLGAWHRADRGPAEAVRRGRYLLAMGQAEAAGRAYERAATGDAEERAAARLGQIEVRALRGRHKPTALIEEYARVALAWRGDATERRAVEARFRLAARHGATRPALESAATLMRYHQLGPRLIPLAGAVTAMLDRLVRPDSPVGLVEAAGTFWDFRDLVPAGGEGDRLALSMAARLEGEGLYARAADLVEYQMEARAGDVTRTALSVRAARLRLLAGEASRAVDLLHVARGQLDPPDLVAARVALEAIALDRLGRAPEAEALLADLAGGSALVGEMRWHRRDWPGFVQWGTARLGGGGRLDRAGEVVLLRQAIALAMVGDGPGLAALGRRNGGRVADAGVAKAFRALTGVRPDAASLELALGAMPGESPAGEWGDLLALVPDQSR